MKKRHELNRNHLMAQSLLEQRIAERLEAEGLAEAADIVFEMHDNTEKELDAFMDMSPSTMGKLRNLGQKMITGFKK